MSKTLMMVVFFAASLMVVGDATYARGHGYGCCVPCPAVTVVAVAPQTATVAPAPAPSGAPGVAQAPRRAYRSYSYAPTLAAEPAASGSMGGYRSYYRGGGSGFSSGGVRSAGSKILGNYGR